MLKYRGVRKRDIPEDISERHKDFNKVLDRFHTNHHTVPLWKKIVGHYPWPVAACLALALSGISYALFTKKENPIAEVKPRPKIQKVMRAFPLQNYILPTDIGSIIDFDSIRLIVPEKTLLPTTEKDSTLIQVSEKSAFHKNNLASGFCFYVQFMPAESYYNNPIFLEYTGIQKSNMKFYYGGRSKSQKQWRPLGDTLDKEKKYATLLNYQKYIEQKKFLDSVRKNYLLDKGQYKKKEGRGMQFDKDFIIGIRKQVKKYETSPSFDSLSNQAKSEMRLFKITKEHEWMVNKRKKEIGSTGQLIEVLQPGWYGVEYR